MESNSKGKTLAIVGLVLGIVSLVLAWWSFINILALVASIIGIICSSKASKIFKEEGQPAGMATAGLVLSIIGLVFSAIFFLTCTLCAGCLACGAKGTVNELNDYLESLR